MPERSYTLRKADTEFVEMLLSPLRITSERHQSEIGDLTKALAGVQGKVSDLERDRDAHSLTVEQAANSARSLLQQANRKLRTAKIIEDDEEPEPDPVVDNRQLDLQHVRRHNGRMIL